MEYCVVTKIIKKIRKKNNSKHNVELVRYRAIFTGIIKECASVYITEWFLEWSDSRSWLVYCNL